MHSLNNKVLFIFNRFYGNFIKDLKANSDDLRNIIKKNYKSLDKLSETYLVEYWKQIQPFKDQIVTSSFDSITDVILLKDLSYTAIIEKVEPEIVNNYIYIFTVISLLYDDINSEEIDEEQKTSLYTTIAGYLLNSEVSLENILDDDIKSLLELIKLTPKPDNTSDEPKTNNADASGDFLGLGNSKIGKLAKEISESIDVSNIKVDSPEDIMKLMDFSGSNNLIGDIIKKASSKVQEQMASGQLKQEDLLGEAMNMMSMFGKNAGGTGGAANPMGGLFDMMSAFSGNPMMRKASTKERLKRKVESRRK